MLNVSVSLESCVVDGSEKKCSCCSGLNDEIFSCGLGGSGVVRLGY